ncbi:MAG: hypothetical protein ACT4QA_20700 [Panacagrimonas sp.]
MSRSYVPLALAGVLLALTTALVAGHPGARPSEATFPVAVGIVIDRS